jgi:hypothetical protein
VRRWVGEGISTSPWSGLCTVDSNRPIGVPENVIKIRYPTKLRMHVCNDPSKNDYHSPNAALETQIFPPAQKDIYPMLQNSQLAHHPLSQPAHPAHTLSLPYTAHPLQTGLRQDPQALSSAESSSTSIASSSLNGPSQSSHRGSCAIVFRCVCGSMIGTGCSIRQKLCSVLFCGCGAGWSCCWWC